jgi:hypothetical protein
MATVCATLARAKLQPLRVVAEMEDGLAKSRFIALHQ